LFARRHAGAVCLLAIAGGIDALECPENLVDSAIPPRMGREEFVGIRNALVEQEAPVLTADFEEADRAVASGKRLDDAEHDG